MANKNYIRGRRLEYEAMKSLREAGAEEVVRSAGSHSSIDVIAFFPGKVFCFQFKKGCKMDKDELGSFLSLRAEVGVEVKVHFISVEVPRGKRFNAEEVLHANS